MSRSHMVYHWFVLVFGIVISLAAPEASAQTQAYDTAYLSNALKLQRGTLNRASSGATYLDAEQACDYVRQEWGWRKEYCGDIEKLVFNFLPSVQSLLIYRPNSDGHVRFGNWSKDARDQEIDELWSTFEQGLRNHGGEVGMTIFPTRWRIRPTLDERQARLYFAFQLSRDGGEYHYARATRFDRKGYVSFVLTPSRPDYSDTELRYMIEDVLSAYQPDPQQDYGDYQSGDDVSVVGVIGVFAGLLGVQHTESVMAVAIADAMERAKEFWYLSFLSVALFARRIFRASAA